MTTKDSLRPGAVALALVSIMLAALASVAWAGREAPTRSLCKSTLVRGVVHLCGPATAKLSAFPGVTFRNGTCKRTVVAGEPNRITHY